MLVQIRTLTNLRFHLEVSEETSVADLIKMIAETQNLPSGNAKIIFHQRPQAPDTKIKDLNIQPDQFLIYHAAGISKTSSEPQSQPTQPTSQPTQPTSQQTQLAQQAQPTEQQHTQQQQPHQEPEDPYATPKGIIHPEQFQSNLQSVQEITGCSKDVAYRALFFSYNNLDRATNMVLDGSVPASLPQRRTQPSHPSQPAPSAGPSQPQGGAPVQITTVEQLMQNPNRHLIALQTIADQYHKNPTATSQIISDYIMEKYPDIYPLYLSEPERVIQIIERILGNVITITPADQTAIMTLINEGAPQDIAVQVYLQSNRDLEASRNTLRAMGVIRSTQ